VERIKEHIKKIPIFSELPEEVLDIIIRAGNIIKYKKDDIILIEDDEGSSLFFILEGRVKVVRTSEDGKEVILTILQKNDFFGEMSLLDGYTRSASVITMENSELFILRRPTFIKLLTEHPGITIKIIQIISNRLRRANLKIKALSIGDSEKKVGAVLLQFALDYGEYEKNSVVIRDLPIQKEIAKMAGTSRETVSRVMKSWKRKGIIEEKEDCIRILDFKKFQETYK
jgi:CRP-like cAMP-binding protein